MLLVMDLPVKGGPTGKTRVKDALHNTLEVAGFVNSLAIPILPGHDAMKFQRSQEYGHGFRALVFDQAEGRILIDTVSAFTTDGQKAPGQTTKEHHAHFHYRTFIKAKLK
jgi:hypothetical protein